MSGQFLEFGRGCLKYKHRICLTHWSVMSDLLLPAMEIPWFLKARIKNKIIWCTYRNQQRCTHSCPLGWVVLYTKWEFTTAVWACCYQLLKYQQITAPSFVSSGRLAGLLHKWRASSKVGIIYLWIWNMQGIFVKIYACLFGCIFKITSWLWQIYVGKYISLFLLNVEECDFCDFRQKWLLQSLYSFSPHGWSLTTLIHHHHEDAAWIQDLSWIASTEAERNILYHRKPEI